MNDSYTTVYVIRDVWDRFIALFMDFTEADDYAYQNNFRLEQHLMLNDHDTPWLMQ